MCWSPWSTEQYINKPNTLYWAERHRTQLREQNVELIHAHQILALQFFLLHNKLCSKRSTVGYAHWFIDKYLWLLKLHTRTRESIRIKLPIFHFLLYSTQYQWQILCNNGCFLKLLLVTYASISLSSRNNEISTK